MANEAIIVQNSGNATDFTVDSGAGVKKGELLRLEDPRTASGAAIGPDDPFAGIAAADKEATSVNGDTSTNLAFWDDGIYVLKAASDSGTISAGASVVMSQKGNNTISGAIAGDLLTGAVIGIALEEISENTSGEVRLRQS